MTELSLWAHLDARRALREIEDADDNTSGFDQFSELDPARAARQMSAVLGIEITPFDLLSPSTALIAKVEAALGGGGSGSGEIVIDFQNGVYTVDGETVALGDLVADSGDYNPSTVNGTGFAGGSEIVGEALVRILAGATVVIDCSIGSSNVGLEPFDTSDFASDLIVEVDDTGIQLRDFGGDTLESDAFAGRGPRRAAFTISSTHLAASAGKTPITLAATTPGGPLARCGVFANETSRLWKLRIIPTVADEDLPALCIPADAKIHIDLVHQFAWTEADGIVAVDTLLGSDPNTENGWDNTEYNPANLTADGYIKNNETGNAPVALIGEALTTVLAGATMCVRSKQVILHDGEPQGYVVLVSADGNDALQFSLAASPSRPLTGASWNGSFNETVNGVTNINVNAINVLALTITDTRADFAANGLTATAGSIDVTDRPPGNPLVAVVVDFGGDAAVAYQSITIYDPLPDTTGLSALSETGVTNTAPHDLVVQQWVSGDSFGEFSVTLSIISNDLASVPARIMDLAVQDDEGNPLQWIVSGDGLEFSIQNHHSGIQRIFLTETPTEGVYHPVFRATDPGGLYVEQEFTITVTS